jgi:hypothetical protein
VSLTQLHVQNISNFVVDFLHGFEAIFKTALTRVSGAYRELFDEKTRDKKCPVTFPLRDSVTRNVYPLSLLVHSTIRHIGVVHFSGRASKRYDASNRGTPDVKWMGPDFTLMPHSAFKCVRRIVAFCNTSESRMPQVFKRLRGLWHSVVNFRAEPLDLWHSAGKLNRECHTPQFI